MNGAVFAEKKIRAAVILTTGRVTGKHRRIAVVEDLFFQYNKIMRHQAYAIPSATLLLLSLQCLLFAPRAASAAVLFEMPTVSSTNGTLDITLTLEESSHSVGNGISLTTRTYNGTLPGPTLRLSPGDSLSIKFINRLQSQLQSRDFVHNSISAPDETNLHFHGLHVIGELPSDDTTHVIRAGESYDYVTQLPADHMPGTHWIHPHRHGSSALQVAGGASLALIVDDPPGFLPWTDMTEVVFVVNPTKIDMLRDIAKEAGDPLTSVSAPFNNFLVVNGQQFR